MGKMYIMKKYIWTRAGQAETRNLELLPDLVPRCLGPGHSAQFLVVSQADYQEEGSEAEQQERQLVPVWVPGIPGSRCACAESCLHPSRGLLRVPGVP